MPSSPRNLSVSLMSTLAVKSALVQIAIPDFEERAGVTVRCTFDPTNVLHQRVSRGERADVLIATRACIADLVATRIVNPQTVRALVRTGVGVAMSAQASQKTLRTVDDLRQLLLDARSVAYSRTGASGVYFAALIERLGIAEHVNKRATIIDKGFTGECVARGESDVAIQQMSELAMVDGIEIVGPLPEECQFHTDFDVAMFAASVQSENAAAFIESLYSDSARNAYRRLGLTVL